MSKIVLGFSGGVDSAVSAVLLQKAGYEVHGLYLDNTDERTRLEAVEAAARMGIELTVIDVRQELDEKVCTPFCESYLRGETPNPCILCNPAVKFRALLAEADRIGAEQVSTGHYARVENGMLYKGRPANDQSYMLCRLRRGQVARVVLPLGRYEKKEVRALAESFGLPAAHKPDSMEICFVPDKNYVNWIAQRRTLPGPGDFVLIDGRKVYVSRIDPAGNTVELALWEELFKREVTARDFNWLIDVPSGPIRASVRVRHTKWEEPTCTVTALPGGGVHIECDEPVRAPAPGQSAVLYDGERVLGGGFITDAK